MVNVLLVLAFVTEPLLWFYTMKKKFTVKSIQFASMFIMLDIIMSLIQEYTNLTEIISQDILSILFFAYMTLFVCLAFEGAIKRKILHCWSFLVL